MNDTSQNQAAALDALETLHDRTVDVLAGFETMVDKAEPAFRPIAERFRELHRRQATALAALVTAGGRTPDADGTFMSTVNRTVVSLRALFDEIDEDVMAQVESGERNVLDAFDAALAQDQTADTRAALASMRQDLTHLLAEAGSEARNL